MVWTLRSIEMAFVKANTAVFYNAKNHRQDPLVLLVVGTMNLDHFEVVKSQRNYITRSTRVSWSATATTP